MKYLLFIPLFFGCSNRLKVTNIVESENECVYYFYSKKIQNWLTIVDTCERFEYGYTITFAEFDTLKK